VHSNSHDAQIGECSLASEQLDIDVADDFDRDEDEDDVRNIEFRREILSLSVDLLHRHHKREQLHRDWVQTRTVLSSETETMQKMSRYISVSYVFVITDELKHLQDCAEMVSDTSTVVFSFTDSLLLALLEAFLMLAASLEIVRMRNTTPSCPLRTFHTVSTSWIGDIAIISS
jgi:hypothetical protein